MTLPFIVSLVSAFLSLYVHADDPKGDQGNRHLIVCLLSTSKPYTDPVVAIPNQLNIYIPKPDSYLATRIKVGSGIVGSVEGDGVCIDYEGNLYGADNVRTYADRVMHAADRHLWRYPNRYPTIARMHLGDEVNDLICIGSFHPDSGTLTIEADPE